jgi:hypothetical protein
LPTAQICGALDHEQLHVHLPGSAIIHDLLRRAKRVVVEIAMPEKSYAENAQSSLEMGMVRVQQRSCLSATANGLYPEEICHGCLRAAGALLPSNRIICLLIERKQAC